MPTFKTWAVGEEVLAADFNTYLQNQVTPVFATTAIRDSEWPSPPNGSTCVVTAGGTTFYERVAGAWYTPFQRLAAAERTTNAATSGTTELVAITTPAVTIPSSRLIRLDMVVRASTGTAGDGCTYRIREGTTISGTVIAETIVVFNPSGSMAATGSGFSWSRIYTPAGGSKQWCLTVAGATAAATLLASTGGPAQVTVTDVGAA